MPYSNYPHGFINGVSVRQMAVPNLYSGKANVFWVDSTRGSDGNQGNFAYPFATLDFAIGECTANNGDIIFCAAAHAETLTSAAAINVDISGITIVGESYGNDRPTFTFSTSTAATFAINAADTYLSNLRFINSINNQVIMLDINAKRAIVDSCFFSSITTTGSTIIDINGGGSNACDGVIISNCQLDATHGSLWDKGIELGAVADGVQIISNNIVGSFNFACIDNPVSTVLTNLLIANNTLRNLIASTQAILLASACTGRLENNDLYASDYNFTLTPGSLFCAGNLSANAINSGGVPIPAQTANPATSTGVGSVFYISKQFTSSTITTSGIDLTTVSTVGDLAIEEIICKTDSTGLAGGTNFKVISNNSLGQANIFQELVSALGSNATVTLENASLTKVPTVLETGKKLQVACTGSNCTGVGVIKVYVKFRRITAAATVASA